MPYPPYLILDYIIAQYSYLLLQQWSLTFSNTNICKKPPGIHTCYKLKTFIKDQNTPRQLTVVGFFVSRLLTTEENLDS